jgi:hypothetical protein
VQGDGICLDRRGNQRAGLGSRARSVAAVRARR